MSDQAATAPVFDKRLPLYNCHKQVRAAQIQHVDHQQGTLDLGPFGFRKVGAEWIGKHQPTDGSYFVEYDDGYTSCSPAAAFEAGYTLV